MALLPGEDGGHSDGKWVASQVLRSKLEGRRGGTSRLSSFSQDGVAFVAAAFRLGFLGDKCLHSIGQRDMNRDVTCRLIVVGRQDDIQRN